MKDQRILDAISHPKDLHLLEDEELTILAEEIRSEIITTTAETGGHVASSLGAVEIILAVHSLINAPEDKFVFDVGHQAYAHKLVTGRHDQFSTLRQLDGIAGFPRPNESEYDVHPSGHASDSLSVAAGLAKARQLRGTDEKIVALIGDASLSGGMAFEALNYIGQAQLPILIILNDNEMSISRNVGALMKHLGNIRATNSYRSARDNMQEQLEQHAGSMGAALVNFGRNVKESIKQFIIPDSMIFESLGIVCTAPIDGHSITALREALRVVLKSPGPVLMHVVTKKGVGYEPAESDPERFHGIGPFDIATGASVKKSSVPTFTDIFGKALVKEAAIDESIVAITAAMSGGTGLKAFAERFPDRFIDVGIAEENALGVASGLAIGGSKPVVAIYSTFMQRAIDQMIVDNALPDLNVVFALDRAGLVGEDGPTHHGVFDLVYTRMIPNMRVFVPADEAELVNGLHTALNIGGPFTLRYPRGSAVGVDLPECPECLEPGVSRLLKPGNDGAILAFGPLAYEALKAANELAKEGLDFRVVDMRWAKPLDKRAIRDAAETGCIITIEPGVIIGGVGEGVLACLSSMGLNCPARVMGIPDKFIQQGKIDHLLHSVGLDAEGIIQTVREAIQSSRPQTHCAY